jgi:HemY protein
MKRVYLWLMVLLAIAALTLLGLAIVEHQGYVLVAYKGFRYESSLWVFIAVLLLVWLLLYLIKLTLRLSLTSAGLVNPWSGLHRNRRARMASELGFVDLAEGRWARALRHLRRAAESEAQPLMYYLGAARAAQQLGQIEESDALLEAALERQPKAELAIALTHAELQQARGQSADALQTLQVMRERHPQHHQVLRQLQMLYLHEQDWSGLLGLLPELRKQGALGAAELAEVTRQAWCGRLRSLGQAEDNSREERLQALADAWQRLSAAQRQETGILAVYAEQLRNLGSEAQAEELLAAALKRQYDSGLVRLYGLLRGRDLARQLHLAEGWLKAHPQDAGLLLTLGRLCMHSQLWGKARGYFESSLAFEQHPETCVELARLLAQLGEVETSNQYFQQGLTLLDRRLAGQC